MTSPTPDETEPPPNRSRDESTGNLLMVLLLASLAMGLGALLAFYIIMGSRAETWPPAGTPRLPKALWISTAIIVISSMTMHWAVRSIRRDRQGGLSVAMVATTLLAVAFLVSQTLNWFVLVARDMPASLNMFAACFYLLTGAHGLHIIAGLIPLAIVTIKAFRGRYSARDYAGVRHCAMFWHFLDVVWLVMFAILMAAG